MPSRNSRLSPVEVASSFREFVTIETVPRAARCSMWKRCFEAVLQESDVWEDYKMKLPCAEMMKDEQ